MADQVNDNGNNDAPGQNDQAPPPQQAQVQPFRASNPFKRRILTAGPSQSDLGYLQHFAPTLTGPKVSNVTRSVTCNFIEVDILATSVYQGITQTLFLGQAIPADIINEQQFVGVVKALFKSRLDHVSSKVSGVRPAARLALNSTLRVPKIIADAINSYGAVTVMENSITLYPISEVAGQGVNPPAFDAAHVLTFINLIDMSEQRSLLTTGNVIADVQGSAAWLLPAFNIAFGRALPAGNPPLANAQTIQVYIRSYFSEFTPADAIISGLLCTNRLTRVQPAGTDLPWYADEIPDVIVLRRRLAGSF